jgi:Barstar (barnase inhibitor)
MNALAQQLANKEAAGSYSLQCGADELLDACRVAGFVFFDADLKGVKGKSSLLDVLARAASFPSGFGGNWDALADNLCDLSWHQASGYVLLLRNANDTLGLAAHDREIVQDIFADTVLYWRQRNKPFWIFFF